LQVRVASLLFLSPSSFHICDERPVSRRHAHLEQSKFEDLTKGSATGAAIRSSGGLELAPSFKLLYATPSTYIWAVAADESGMSMRHRSPARVYRITPDGTATIILSRRNCKVQTLEVDHAV